MSKMGDYVLEQQQAAEHIENGLEAHHSSIASELQAMKSRLGADIDYLAERMASEEDIHYLVRRVDLCDKRLDLAFESIADLRKMVSEVVKHQIEEMKRSPL